MTEKIKPCPLCGGSAFVATVEHPEENRPHGYRFHGRILCRQCQASAGTTGFDETYEEATIKAISRWNARPAEDRLRAQRDRNARGMAAVAKEVACLPFCIVPLEHRPKGCDNDGGPYGGLCRVCILKYAKRAGEKP